MILVTGGSGFIGSHTVRALHGLGEPSVVMQRRSGQVPPHLADLPVVAEQADVADLGSLRAIGGRHEITGIVHLAGYPAPRGTAGGIEATAGLLDGLLNIARVAAEWGVRRVSLASTLGVYGGIAHSGPLTEDLPVLLTAPHPIPRSKKIAELLGEQLAEATGAEVVSLRISGTWGPLGHEDPFFAAPALIHAAASGKPLDLSALLIPPHLGDGLDLCYVKDTGRAIALVQLAGHLQHRTYNIASGRVTTNAEVIAAIREAVPEAELGLPAGAAARRRPRHHPAPPGHRVRAGVRHRPRGRRRHRLAQGGQRTLTRAAGSPAATTPASARRGQNQPTPACRIAGAAARHEQGRPLRTSKPHVRTPEPVMTADLDTLLTALYVASPQGSRPASSSGSSPSTPASGTTGRSAPPSSDP